MTGIVLGIVILLAAVLVWWVRSRARHGASSKQREREKFDREREADRLACLEAERSINPGVAGPAPDESSLDRAAASTARGRAASERWKAANPPSSFDDDLPVP